MQLYRCIHGMKVFRCTREFNVYNRFQMFEPCRNQNQEFLEKISLSLLFHNFFSFKNQVDFIYIFMRKSWFKIFGITMELHRNLKNIKLCFSHENIEQIHFS